MLAIGTNHMFSKIFKILRESISSVTNGNLWELTTKDLFLRENFRLKQPNQRQPLESSSKFIKGQLVSIRYHQNWKHLHKEIGIILEAHDYSNVEKIESVYFYEVLVGDEKITVLERFLDGYIGTEEESSS